MSASKKDLLKDINSVVEHSRQHCKSHEEEIKQQEKFLGYLMQIIEKEAPEFRGKMAEIQTLYNSILEKEKLLLGAEERTAEDINDIAARFDVIYRVSDESLNAKKKVKECRARIEKLRKDLELDELKGGAKKYKIEGDINKAIEAKKQAIEAAEAKLLEFIDVKEKYTVFKVNRLTHAYSSYGKIVAEAMKDQSENAEKLSQCISEAQESIDQLLEQEPAPEPAIAEPEATPDDNEE